MKVLNLRCAQQHAFEGWFGSEDEFQSQLSRGLVSCPMCGDAQVDKLPSAPRLNLGASAAETPVPVSQAPALADAAHRQRSAAAWRAMRDALAQAEDVGERFADEARRMHHGHTAHRQIRGQASLAEAVELLEEGVPVLPLPEAMKETLQ